MNFLCPIDIGELCLMKKDQENTEKRITTTMKNFRNLNATLLLSATLFLVASCSLVELDEPGPTAPVDAPEGIPATVVEFTELLVGDDSRVWRALTFELEGMSGFQSCRLDDTFTFFADGTYRYDGGEVLCQGADDTRIKTGIWELDLDNRQLIFDRGTSIAYTSNIGGLDNNRIQLTGQVDIFGQQMDIEGIYETGEN